MTDTRVDEKKQVQVEDDEEDFLRKLKIFMPLRLKDGEIPDVKQRLCSIAAIAGVVGIGFRVGRVLLTRILSEHPQWPFAEARSGMFHPKATEELVYLFLTGTQHVATSLLASKSCSMLEQGRSQEIALFGMNARSLHYFALLTELAYEWGDWLRIFFKTWPYEDIQNPFFKQLMGVHHSFGILLFFMTGSETIFDTGLSRAMNPLLSVAGFSCLMYPLQQLSDLETLAGARRALYINAVNSLLFAYVRFVTMPVKGKEFVEKVFLKSDQEDNKVLKTRLMYAAFGLLTVFNVLVMAGSFEKVKLYYDTVQALKAKNVA